MKTVKFLIILSLISFHTFAVTQPSRDQAIIKRFLTYIAGPRWHIDTVVSKYVVFYEEESKVASRATRKMYLSMAVADLVEQVKRVKIDELKIIPYNDVDEKLQIMTLGPDYRQRSYVVTDPSGKFVRYFLLKDDQIESFVLFQGKAYLLLN
ncbi:hypothetical protein [Chitinophaga cymbidii]|uniref:Uncharacterized protein n=1 Tax=Chitinophaga cymbidii TaxID=1096750 RepID=A0A512RSB4_9BACT|nr:hypothetical protein [Chitinophaga cymbidii]GEP98574.1 hypothetical protein CCY01nite_48340 [Chitinophaga cymbidii]